MCAYFSKLLKTCFLLCKYFAAFSVGSSVQDIYIQAICTSHLVNCVVRIKRNTVVYTNKYFTIFYRSFPRILKETPRNIKQKSTHQSLPNN